MIINVFGKIGSGKSTICHYISQKYGFEFINVDDLNHLLYEEKEFLDIVRAFAPDSIDKDNKIIKDVLRTKLFKDEYFNWKILDYSSNWVNNWLKGNLNYTKNYIIESFTTRIFKNIKIDHYFFLITKRENQLFRVDERDHRLVYETNNIVIFQEKILNLDLNDLSENQENISYIYNNGDILELENIIDEEMKKIKSDI